MAVNGSPWQSMAVNGSQWQSMAVNGSPWQSMAVHGSPWQSMASEEPVHVVLFVDNGEQVNRPRGSIRRQWRASKPPIWFDSNTMASK